MKSERQVALAVESYTRNEAEKTKKNEEYTPLDSGSNNASKVLQTEDYRNALIGSTAGNKNKRRSRGG